MLILKVYSIFVMVALLINIINESEDRAVVIASCIVFIPIIITLIYGGVC